MPEHDWESSPETSRLFGSHKKIEREPFASVGGPVDQRYPPASLRYKHGGSKEKKRDYSERGQ